MASSGSGFHSQKRPLDESSSDNKDTQQKMMKRQSFYRVAVSAMRHRQLENIIEPMLRKVVREEVERAVTRRFGPRMTRSPSLRIQAPEPLPLQLAFVKPFKAPIFTLNRLASDDGSPLQVLLFNPRSDPTSPFPPAGSSMKIKIVVLPGDFPAGERTTWSAEEFNNGILKARSGKRPLIAGNVTQTFKPAAEAAEFTDLIFTDNSRCTRSGKFRLGAQVAVEEHSGHYAGFRILEAVSEAVVVKDHRGEPNMKHYPPKLDDEVWRLVKIRKGGSFHNSLSSNGISTVQDLLKMSIADPDRLRGILGPKMTSKKWKSVNDHANTCEIGNKLYAYVIPSACQEQNQTSLVLDSVCHAVAAQINGQTISIQQLLTLTNMDEDFIGILVKDAYLNWNSLQKVDWF